MGNSGLFGWVVHLNKYVDRSEGDFKELQDYFEEKRKNQNSKIGLGHMTTFGNFDRLTFAPVNFFSDYYVQTGEDSGWIGRRKSILLYRVYLPENRNPQLLFEGQEENGEGKSCIEFSFKGQKTERRPRFICLSMLRPNYEGRAGYKKYEDYIRDIVVAIHNYTEQYNEDLPSEKADRRLECEVFGSFDASEIGIVWLSDQYVGVLELMDRIREMQFMFGNAGEIPVFVSSYTIISVNRENGFNNFDEVEGRAVIQLETSSARGESESDNRYIDYLRTVIKNAHIQTRGEILSTSGEYDYILSIDSKDLFLLFPTRDNKYTAPLSIHNTSFTELFRQTTTRLTCEIKPEPQQEEQKKQKQTIIVDPKDMVSGQWELSKPMPVEYLTDFGGSVKEFTCSHLDDTNIYSEDAWLLKDGKAKPDHPKYEIECLIQTVKEKYPESNVVRTLKLLYADYVDVLSCQADRMWVRDYQCQFLSVVRLISCEYNYIEEKIQKGFEKSKLLNELSSQVVELANILRKQISHIVQSGKIFFETPESKMGYTAQFDFIFHAYYGFVKALIQSSINEQKRTSWQYPLVPIINFEDSPIIRSVNYIPRIQDKKTRIQDRKNGWVLSLRLPYMSWAEPAEYIPYLIHEIYSWGC